MEMLEAFFARYEKAFNAFDVEAILDAYADCSIGATPLGSACAKKDERLRAALSQAYDFYKTLYERNHIASVQIVARTETPITDFCSMASITWGLFREDGSEVYRFDVTYIVQAIDGNPKIILFVAPDEQKLLREKGLL